MSLYVCARINGWGRNRTGNLQGQAGVEILGDDDILQVSVRSGSLGDYVSHCEMTGSSESVGLRMKERNIYRGPLGHLASLIRKTEICRKESSLRFQDCCEGGFPCQGYFHCVAKGSLMAGTPSSYLVVLQLDRAQLCLTNCSDSEHQTPLAQYV
jgi:hypothetical protein